MSKQMTPCEKLGYKVGDEFEVIRHHAFKKGQVVTLHEDDGTECPLFSGDGGGAGVFDGVECSFATLNKQVRKIANKLKPAKQALADAINQNGGGVEGGDWHKNGELPPVGEVCEVMHLDRWACCEVIAHFEQSWGMVAAYTVGINGGNAKLLEQCNAEDFRPLRTERDKAVDEMVDCLSSRWANCEAIAAHLYENGYRKEVK